MSSYWLGIAGHLNLQSVEKTEVSWCLPIGAAKGDRILFYCPRAVSFHTTDFSLKESSWYRRRFIILRIAFVCRLAFGITLAHFGT